MFSKWGCYEFYWLLCKMWFIVTIYARLKHLDIVEFTYVEISKFTFILFCIESL